MNYSETYLELDNEEATVCTYCGSGFFLLMCVQLYKQNRYRDTEIFLMSEESKVHRELSIQSNVTHVEGVKSSSIYTIRAVMLYMSEVLKVHTGLSIQSVYLATFDTFDMSNITLY